MQKELEQIILKSTHSHQVVKTETIQELWSGYGTLSRVSLDQNSVILKLIQLSQQNGHPRGWNTSLSHKRKVKSYEVEKNWYRNFNKHEKLARTANLIQGGELDTAESYLILEDLKHEGFLPIFQINSEQIKLGLTWLANFHKTYLKEEPTGLWKVGTYWHLATRPEELAALEDKNLKSAAPLIDKKLNQAQYKTLVHGDAKLANFLFSENQVAAVDFQYVGGGVGVKDVAYFLSSIFNEDQLHSEAEKYLDYYFHKLALPTVEKEWRELYAYAWCDFYRFLKGWSPGHYKLNTYSENMKNKVLSWI